MPQTKHSIFIVDDDADDRESIRDAFMQTKLPQEFRLMSSGDELMKQLRTTATFPSLILLDLNMPGKDGRSVLQEIKSDKNLLHIPVVVFTTSSSAKDRQAVYKLGANCFVTKPDSYIQIVRITESIARLWLNAR